MHAIIVSRRDFREFDQVISMYTKEKGKCELVAKGVKKITSKNTAHLEPSFFVDLKVHPGRQFEYIGSVQIIKAHRLHNDIQRRMVMAYGLSIFDRFVGPGNPDDRLFDFFKQWILECVRVRRIDGEFVDRYLLQLLSHLGVVPELSSCALCDEKDVVMFSVSSGGMVCGACVGDDAQPFHYGRSRKQLLSFGEYHLDKKVFY